MTSFSVIIPIAPRAKGRPRFWRGHAVTDTTTRVFERSLKLQLQLLVRAGNAEKLLGPLSVTLVFFLKRPKQEKNREFPFVRPDIDNYGKAACDAANGVLWSDDAQICDLFLYKRYCLSDQEPSIHVTVKALGITNGPDTAL